MKTYFTLIMALNVAEQTACHCKHRGELHPDQSHFELIGHLWNAFCVQNSI